MIWLYQSIQVILSNPFKFILTETPKLQIGPLSGFLTHVVINATSVYISRHSLELMNTSCATVGWKVCACYYGRECIFSHHIPWRGVQRPGYPRSRPNDPVVIVTHCIGIYHVHLYCTLLLLVEVYYHIVVQLPPMHCDSSIIDRHIFWKPGDLNMLMCDNFKFSKCYTTVIWFSFITLFSMQGLYGLIWNTYVLRYFTNYLHNSSALHSRPYTASCIWTYKSGFPLLIMMSYFWYILGDTFNMRSASASYSNMITSSSVTVRRYDPGMSNMATPQP